MALLVVNLVGRLCFAFLLLSFLLGVVAVGLAAPFETRQEAGKRVALIIGNSAYPHIGHLENPQHDARDFSRYLKALKFEVITKLDLSLGDTHATIDQFMANLGTDDTAVFYYSGHAVQLSGQNYILPSDAKIAEQQDVAKAAINLNTLIAKLEKRKGTNLIFLDACRDNPFDRAAQTGTNTRNLKAAKKRSIQRMPQGLAAINSDSGNTLIVYAAAAGKLAADGTGQRNSPFTHALLNHISTPDLEVEVMLKRVTADVRIMTKSGQSPERLSRLTTEFYFNPKPKEKTKAKSLAALPRPALGAQENSEVGTNFRSCPSCPTMTILPKGSFKMGDRAVSSNNSGGLLPAHLIEINHSFAVAQTEITFEQWGACVADGACRHYRPKDNGWGRGARPVINVSWQDANAYIDWLKEKTGRPYRLLSEAEWEYAGRAGTNELYINGRSPNPKFANFDGSLLYTKGRPGLYRAKTVVVGQFPANAYGIHNMAGNVSEWVADCWHDNFDNAPQNGEARLSGNCQSRVVRGGAWYNDEAGLRSSVRSRYDANTRLNIIGFRVALTLSKP